MAIADKIWLGWTPRESGSKGFRCINGDSGKAQGKYQFDYRYSLVPFMKFCVNLVPEHYSGFKAYIELGDGNRELIHNSGLTNLWTELCDKYPTEFENLQNSYAYQTYYLPVKSQILKLYKIDLDKRSPVVKGSAFSMAIRSGTTGGAKKFNSCNENMTDEEILRSAYGKYAGNDGNRWTESKQLGDALRALERDEFTYIFPDGTTITEEKEEESSVVVETPKEEVKKELYHVGTAWKNGKCVNQHGAFTSLDNAKKDCNNAKNSIKKTYHVFDSMGVIVYTETYKEPVKTNILYKVGTAWKNGRCIEQKGAFVNLLCAKSSANGARNTFKKSHYVFDNEGNIIFSAEYSNPKDNFYRVGTGWSRGICFNQKGAFAVATFARNLANSLTKKTGTIYFVFDPTGKVIYTGSKK